MRRFMDNHSTFHRQPRDISPTTVRHVGDNHATFHRQPYRTFHPLDSSPGCLGNVRTLTLSLSPRSLVAVLLSRSFRLPALLTSTIRHHGHSCKLSPTLIPVRCLTDPGSSTGCLGTHSHKARPSDREAAPAEGGQRPDQGGRGQRLVGH